MMKRILLAVFVLGMAAIAYRVIWFDRPPGSVSGAVTVAPVDDWLGWTAFGGDDGQQRYAPLAQITPDNVRHLQPVWHYRTGDMERNAHRMDQQALEVTPILAAGHLVLCTPFNRVVALDPATGKERWSYDPELGDRRLGNKYVCRGVSQWQDSRAPSGEVCAHRIFMATNDFRVVALDAGTGKPCEGFGTRGVVTIDPGRPELWNGEFQITSPPVIVRDRVIVGSSISDNQRIDAPLGIVRAFDARTGALAWVFDPIARAPDPGSTSWPDAHNAGHANVWTVMSADHALGLVYLPTSSPSVDFWGGARPGDNLYANSVVALDAASGAVRWHFQTIHHDVWDFDLPAGPSFVDLSIAGHDHKALVQPTKTGFLFVLDRQTGAPLFGVEERPVPQGGVLGEHLSKTQPFPLKPPALVPQGITPEDAFGLVPGDKGACRAMMEKAGPARLFSPPDEDGVLMFPFTGGGVNWGGIAIDPNRKIAIANTSRAVHLVTLHAKDKPRPDDGLYHAPMAGAPFDMTREVLLSPNGLPCNAPPWGALTAVDLEAGEILWESTLGTTRHIAGPVSLKLGTPNLGGALVTQSGLVFVAATMDRYMRAFDLTSGKELWGAHLPAAAQAGPMSYAIGGRQYVVIAAGGHAQAGTAPGDSIIAFALPSPAQ